MKQISVMITDDHQMVIRGMRNMLEDAGQIKITATFGNGKELLEGLQKNIPDVLILDIQMPGVSGSELAAIISENYPSVRMLALTNSDQIFDVHSMFGNGVLGYLLKNTDPDTLVKAIETVSAGQQYIDPLMKEKLLDGVLRNKKEAESRPILSRRENEVLQLIVLGLTSHEIAEKLFLSQRTINNYRLNLLFKLDVKNTASLVRKAITLGLTE